MFADIPLFFPNLTELRFSLTYAKLVKHNTYFVHQLIFTTHVFVCLGFKGSFVLQWFENIYTHVYERKKGEIKAHTTSVQGVHTDAESCEGEGGLRAIIKILLLRSVAVR